MDNRGIIAAVLIWFVGFTLTGIAYSLNWISDGIWIVLVIVTALAGAWVKEKIEEDGTNSAR